MAEHRNKKTKLSIPQVDTTTLGASGPQKPSSRRRHARTRRSSTSNTQTLITRRKLLLGAAGLGAVAAGAAGIKSLTDQEQKPEESLVTLSVPEESVFDLETCVEVDPGDAFELIGDFELPFGTLVWVDDDHIAACLFPTEEPSPLVYMGILQLSNGAYYIMREEAVGAEEGFEIYDVRASSAGLVWMEAIVMEGRWRVYVASLNEALSLGEPMLVDEGTAEQEAPSLAILDNYAFWQTMAPVTNENARHEPAIVKRAALNTGTIQTVFEGVGRMAAPLMPYAKQVVFTPRHENATSYCDLVCMDAKTAQVRDQLTLPSGMMPNQVAYGPTGFAFCFENIYDYGGGIANLGTYTPVQAVKDSSYDESGWFRFNRTPTAPPCWCTENWFMVKSNQSVCAVNLSNKVFCSFGVESGCQDWGDYLVSSGIHDTVVTASQIDQVDTEGKETKMTQVRVWTPLAKVPTSPESNTEANNQDQNE